MRNLCISNLHVQKTNKIGQKFMLELCFFQWVLYEILRSLYHYFFKKDVGVALCTIVFK